MKKLTTEQFINKSKEKHGDKYDYSLVEYINGKIKVKIICKKHGIFEQTPCKHLIGDGCSSCSGNKKMTTLEFIEKSKKIHGNKYNYSLVEYIGLETKVKIICPIHGIFEQSAHNHINKKRGCSKCNGGVKLTKEEFILNSIKKHGNKYDYSLVIYVNADTKVKIICPEHGIFEQKPRHHIYKCSCKKCNKSKGENNIDLYLKERNISFDREKTFKKCKFKKVLPFDFYLIEFNICIEYDGEQHYKSIKFYGGEKNFELRKIKDNIKTNFCKDNDIKLIRIRYDENIEEKLNLEL